MYQNRPLQHPDHYYYHFVSFEKKSVNVGKIPVLAYLEGSEGLNLKIQKGQVPNSTIVTVLRSKIF